MIKMTIKERLFKNRFIDEKTGCWLWTKSLSWDQYGQITINGKSYRVHRISYQEFIGPVINNILHKTICPYKHCFNPDHLYDGTQMDNIQDTITLGRHFGTKKY